MTKLPPWITGLLMALLLGTAYVWIWRPARAWLTQQAAYPALAALETERARQFALIPGVDPLMIDARPADAPSGPTAATFRAPAGILLLLPALFLVGFFPFRPYWFYFWLYHLGLGVLVFAVFYLGVGWSSWGWAGYGFLRSYVVPATSLAAPVLALAYAPARSSRQKRRSIS